MHAFLIITPTQEKLAAAVRQLLQTRSISDNAKSVHTIAPESNEGSEAVGIDAIRELRGWLALVSQQTIVIPHADRLTIPAQHALLKTLEDAEDHIIILAAPGEDSLLPTIRSRCAIIRVPQDIKEETEADEAHQELHKFLEQILRLGPSDRIALWTGHQKTRDVFPNTAPDASAKEQLLVLISAVVNLSRLDALGISQGLGRKEAGAFLVHAAIAHRRLQENCNPQLVIQQFLLDIPKSRVVE